MGGLEGGAAEVFEGEEEGFEEDVEEAGEEGEDEDYEEDEGVAYVGVEGHWGGVFWIFGTVQDM